VLLAIKTCSFSEKIKISYRSPFRSGKYRVITIKNRAKLLFEGPHFGTRVLLKLAYVLLGLKAALYLLLSCWFKKRTVNILAEKS